MNKRYAAWIACGILLSQILASAYDLSFVKIDALMIAANGSADISTGKGYNVGLVAFSGEEFYCPHGICSYRNLTKDPASLHAQINSYDPMSGTCISCGINKARDILSTAGGGKYIVILSDGVPNCCASADGGHCSTNDGITESLSQAALAQSEGIKVYTVALGNDADYPFLQNLSNASGGKTYNVSCTSTLEQIYRDISENEATDNLVLVSDISGSMSDTLTYSDCTSTTTTSSTSTSTTSTTSTTLGECSCTADQNLSAGKNTIDFQTPHDYHGSMDCYSGTYTCPAGYGSRVYLKYDIETWYDHLYMIDAASLNSSVLYGNSSGYVWYTPENVSSVRFRFSSDASVNRWGVDVDTIECFRPVETTTTSTSTTSSTTTTTTTSTTTTTEGPCTMPGNDPPCAEISLEEVISAINRWIEGSMGLDSVIDLINAWAGAFTPY